MSYEKGDISDSVAKTGGIIASGILCSVFLPSILSSLIGSWIEEQMATNPTALVLACVLSAASGAGVACSIALPIMKRSAKKRQIVISRRKLRSDILALPGESKAMLEWLHREGDVSTVDRQRNARMMHLMGCGMVGMIEKTISLDDSIGDTWMVIPRVSNIIDKDMKVSGDLDKAYEYWYEDTE